MMCVLIIYRCSTNQALSHFASPGGWNDPDMLVGSSPAAAVFNTPTQSRTQFSLWAIMAAPLLIGSNMLNMTVRS
jgi:alpha-galactosidase